MNTKPFFLKILILLLKIVVSISVSGQTVNIPDNRFLKALIFNKIDLNKNDSIEIIEALACDTLNVNTIFNIEDLKGIEAFKNLVYLDCSQNDLVKLDVSQNINLKKLSCSFNNIENLDISKNLELTHLDCAMNRFSSINVSKNSKLSILQCLYNRITTLDLSNNKELLYLDVGW